MSLGSILDNPVLWTAFAAWLLAQTLKIPVGYLRTRQWDWALFFAAGGMPSSHSALVVSTAIGAGLHAGFNSPVFALAVAVAMVVVYDATGVRRQAGIQAKQINILVQELLKGHPISEEHLREVIGHTPFEAIAGSVLGVVIAVVVWLIWK